MRQQTNRESPLLDHPVIPVDDFRKKLKAILSVPKSELDESLERERKANEGKPKRGPKRKAERGPR